METVRLNIGAGKHEMEGYTSIDRKNGCEGYPLEQDDNSVEEIYASHVLEHFSHQDASKVLTHWVQKLKPGGRLRVAVPNFEWIARKYLAGEPINVQGYVMGGHSDGNDLHGAIFDGESLTEIMANTGLERIGRWESEHGDCSSLPVSLNLQGFKPLTADRTVAGVVAVLSAPRYGPVAHFKIATGALLALQIPYSVGQGAYWSRVLCDQIDSIIKDGDPEFILTMDYDSVFRAQDIVDLYRIMKSYSDIDAVCAVQSKRGSQHALFGMVDKEGKPVGHTHKANFDRNATTILTGHFGLTMFRTAGFKALPKPWMLPPEERAEDCTDEKVDADIQFWYNWRDAGLKVALANRVPIGHLQEVVTWPGKDFSPLFQLTNEYIDSGIPPEVVR